MKERQARDIIELDIKQKMLGPGYASDIFAYSDSNEEILHGDPRMLYSLGVLLPKSKAEDDVQDTVEEELITDNSDFEQEYEDFEQEYEANPSQDNADDYDSAIEIEDSDSEDVVETNGMTSHIGLTTCLHERTEDVIVTLSFGTYKKLNWTESGDIVRVKVGKCASSIQNAINTLSQDNVVATALSNNNLPSLKDCIIVDNDANTIAIASAMTHRPNPRIPLRRNDIFPIEAGMIDMLFSNHYKRVHHSYSVAINLCSSNKRIELCDGCVLYWEIFNARNKQFLKVLFENSTSQPIFQPILSIEVKNGSIDSFVEPIPSIFDDFEASINDFIYRKVKNYGKGINCALDWEEDDGSNVVRVFTSFTPTIDIKKFSNDVVGDNPDLQNACILRNLSVWSNISDSDIIDMLRKFIDGYREWHKSQNASEVLPNYQRERDYILSQQEELVYRLADNVEYLANNAEALQCFKIANTAMLLQMVVARHPAFMKNRRVTDINNGPRIYDDIKYFHNAEYTAEVGEPKYRPFQLAFLLMNVKSTFDIHDRYHNQIVDLIWFPTGGGKTEAYLALTALTIVHRRRRGQYRGVSVIMRYTLRLLTTQQFERASYLVCALEFLRTKDAALRLGNNAITIGLYVGSGVTPNTPNDLRNAKFTSFFRNPANATNPFPVHYCPWCGSQLVSGNLHGYNQRNGNLTCLNRLCCFRGGLPIYYIDQSIYENKPTLLFATVDKFAQLYRPNAASLFYDNDNTIDPADLIIQDELHLIVGALGSIVGLFEPMVEALCTQNQRKPKIIASTATTRNTADLIKRLFNREVSVFPPLGLEYSDNYFSKVVENEEKRRHIGMMPSNHISSNVAEIRLTAFLLLSKIKLFKQYLDEYACDWLDTDSVLDLCTNNQALCSVLDYYWSIVLYYNSLKDLGRSRSRISQEVAEYLKANEILYTTPKSLSFIVKGFYQRVIEFTSRIDSSRIKTALTKASDRTKVERIDNDAWVNSATDLVLSSNMISVGIDIERWNVMVMVGQPRSTSEYVQSSSRVARKVEGLVINLLNPIRVREKSLFENYQQFHTTYYKSVEPLSITPLTYATINHAVFNNIIKIFRDYIENDPGIDKEDLAYDLKDFMGQRFGIAEGDIIEEAGRIIEHFNDTSDKYANSLRDVDKNANIKIGQIEY